MRFGPRPAFFVALLVGWSSADTVQEKRLDRHAMVEHFAITDGAVVFQFSAPVLDRLGLWFTPRGDVPAGVRNGAEGDLFPSRMALPIEPGSSVSLESIHGRAAVLKRIEVSTRGALMTFPFAERLVLGNFAISRDPGGEMRISSTLEDPLQPKHVFDVDSIVFGVGPGGRSFWLTGELIVVPDWAQSIGRPEAAGTLIGAIRIEARLLNPIEDAVKDGSCASTPVQSATAAAAGPDVIVSDLQSTMRYVQRVGDITAYAIGTTSCNIGTERASWIAHTNAHPVIIQNIYRLDDRGFQQIGMSWLKHGFYAVSQSLCSPCNDPTDGTQLGVGCSDPYSAPLNGDQDNMSPRSTLNAHTGAFPYPWQGPGAATAVDRRVQVHDADVDPARNPDARYFIEGHYLMADDAAAGNADNNASYREVRVVVPSADIYGLVISPTLTTQRGQAAVRAWKDADPGVVETDVRVPGEGLFILAAKATMLTGGWYRYQYALQNLNSDRGARVFTLQLPPSTSVQNVGFRDIHHHSGEPFATGDWTSAVQDGVLRWHTSTYAENPNANALRFGSVFSFWFDCNVEPATAKIHVALFKPGFPEEIVANSVGPRPELIDCNGNLIADTCDLDCAAPDCAMPCGSSTDCDSNGVPDECQADCDDNGTADACDIANCPAGDPGCADCNGNNTPDRCEPDCDGDGTPDSCEETLDTDQDGYEDCVDECPMTTPPGVCAPPALVTCRYRTGLCVDLPRYACIEQGGTPVCGEPAELRCQFGVPCPESRCRYGCRIGDMDGDGDIDLFDESGFQRCFSGEVGGPRYSLPGSECLLHFDYDEDADVDLRDHDEFCALMGVP